jgi:hypothetical protein
MISPAQAMIYAPLSTSAGSPEPDLPRVENQTVSAAGARFILAVVPSAGLTIARHGESVANSEDSLGDIAKTATSNSSQRHPGSNSGRGESTPLHVG